MARRRGGTSKVVSVDEFTKGMQDILKDLKLDVLECSEEAAKGAGKAGSKNVRRNARNVLYASKRTRPGARKKRLYVKGFSYKVRREYDGVRLEIGNRRFPGLVHLLEKGHLTQAGNKVPAYPHLKQEVEPTYNMYLEGIAREIGKL